MYKLVCDTCDADLTKAENAWGLQLAELKHNDNVLIMHFCNDCQNKLFIGLETVIKGMINGKS